MIRECEETEHEYEEDDNAPFGIRGFVCKHCGFIKLFRR